MKRLLLFALVLGMAACSAGSGGRAVPSVSDTANGTFRAPLDVLGGAPSMRSLKIALFDAPLANAPGAKVNIALDGIQLLAGGNAIPFSTNAQAQVVNLLDLQDHSLDFDGKAPAGVYSGVRFVINTAGSNVVIGGMTIPIVWGTPRRPVVGPVVAVDISVPFAVLPNGDEHGGTSVDLDFNVMQSVRFVRGTIYIQPSVSGAASAAKISGNVASASGTPVAGAAVVAMDPLGHVVNVTATRTDGSYTLHALPPGFYTIAVRNTYLTASGETLTASGNDANAAPSQRIVLSPHDDLHLGTLTD